MTPAQAKKVWGRTTIDIVMSSNYDKVRWVADFCVDGINVRIVPAFEWWNESSACHHAREFFKKLGLKVRFGK